MLMNMFKKIIFRLFGADPDAVAAYRSTLPKNIQVSVKQDNDCLIATVHQVDKKEVKGLLITEAKDMPSLINMVNDLVYTYARVPENVRPYYGNVFKPEGYRQNDREMVLVRA